MRIMQIILYFISFNLLSFANERLDEFQYSINVAWINNQLDPDQLYIYPARSDDELRVSFIDPILGWAKLNPETTVNVWYDSQMITAVSLNNTREKVYSRMFPNTSQVQFRDIRDLDCVKNYPDSFSSRLPVYIRADLSRVIASLEGVNSEEPTYFVYADLDMPPIRKQDIFDEDTLQKLNTYGLVMARPECGFPAYENGFFIMSNLNKHMMEAVKIGVVEYNLLNSILFLNSQISAGHDWGGGSTVYLSYQKMFGYFYALSHNVDFVEDYNEQTIFDRCNSNHIQNIYMFRGLFSVEIRREIYDCGYKVPTKTVVIPKLSHKYNTANSGNNPSEFR